MFNLEIKRLKKTAALAVLILTQSAYADSFFVGIEAAGVSPEAGSFKDGSAVYGLAGYRFKQLSAAIGVYAFEDFVHRAGQGAYIEQDGYELQLAYHFDFSVIEFDALAGAFFWEERAYYNGLRVGQDSGSSPMIGLNAGKTFADHFKVYLNVKRFNDVSGQDMNLLGAGFRYVF